MALAITGTGNGSLNNLALSANTGTIVDTGRAGGIIQVVTATTSTSVTVSSSTMTDTTLTASITPTSSSNKILVMVCQHANAYGGSAAKGGIQIVRDSTTIYESLKNSSSLPYQFSSESNGLVGFITINFLDSPSTTSSTTYKTQGAAGAHNMLFQGNDQTNAVSTITLMEIVA